ncbi:MAG: DUF3179 domain-containing protein [Halobacteriales archaeon]
MRTSRRALLAAVGGVALAGCLGDDDASADDGGATPTASRGATPELDPPTPPDVADAPPLSKRPVHLAHDRATLLENVVSGGVSRDGIPAIDDPRFAPADGVDLADGDPVFGLSHDGVARAYPQEILVWHEVVNDVIGDTPIAVTYCPLTGTAQAFHRGPTSFGVSGRLVNSNLVMYDRASDSWWPQVLATAIDGPLHGQYLREERVSWTTWDRWRSAHPETEVLTDDTGYARRYGSDPYGTYNPRGGYYDNRKTLFPALSTDDRAHPKAVVVGARTAQGAVAFRKSALLEAGVLEGHLGDEAVVAVADGELATGHVYRNPDGRAVTPDGDRVAVDGEAADPDDLPLERVLAIDAMWFAWAGFYPDTTHVA